MTVQQLETFKLTLRKMTSLIQYGGLYPMGEREKSKENIPKDTEKLRVLQNTTMPMEFQFLEWNISRMSQ